MLTSINPLGERIRGNRWLFTVMWLTLGGIVGGAVLGAVAGVFTQVSAPTGHHDRNIHDVHVAGDNAEAAITTKHDGSEVCAAQAAGCDGFTARRVELVQRPGYGNAIHGSRPEQPFQVVLQAKNPDSIRRVVGTNALEHG